jgi:hypothetical protein
VQAAIGNRALMAELNVSGDSPGVVIELPWPRFTGECVRGVHPPRLNHWPL